MYYNTQLWSSKLGQYAVTPSVVGYFGSEYEDLDIPASPDVIATGDHSESSRAVWATLAGKPVVAVQHLVSGTYSEVYAVYDIPAEFDWTQLIPAVEAYQPQPVAFSFEIGDGWHFAGQFDPARYNVQLVGTLSRGETSVKAWHTPNLRNRTIISEAEFDGANFDPVIKRYRMELSADDIAVIDAWISATNEQTRSELYVALMSRRKIADFGSFRTHLDAICREKIGSTFDHYGLSPLQIAEHIETKIDEILEYDTEWNRIEESGTLIVALRRCWECGDTQVMGELTRTGVKSLDEAKLKAARAAQQIAHAASAIPEDEAVSSIGFTPQPGMIEFRVVDDEWYCGC